MPHDHCQIELKMNVPSDKHTNRHDPLESSKNITEESTLNQDGSRRQGISEVQTAVDSSHK